MIDYHYQMMVISIKVLRRDRHVFSPREPPKRHSALHRRHDHLMITYQQRIIT
jgi:hypothetical protein